MVQVIKTGTFKELLLPGLVEAIKRKGHENVFKKLREDMKGTGLEQDIEELYNELA